MRRKLEGWAKSSANRISVGSRNLSFSKSSDIVSNLGEIYSRGLRNLVYFEVYGFGQEIRTRRGIYYRYPGVVLSSFRLVDVLVSRDLLKYLHSDEKKREFIVVRKCGGNTRVVIKSRDADKISYIYDVENLRKITGKSGSIPERLMMRLKKLKNGWVKSSVVEDILRSSNYSVCGVLILNNYLRMKLYELDRSWVFHVPWYQLSDKFIVRYDRNGRITLVTISNLSFNMIRDIFSSIISSLNRQRYDFLLGDDSEVLYDL